MQSTLEASWSSFEPHLLTQGDFCDLVRGLNLSEKQAELTGSGLKGCNHLHIDTEKCCILYSQNDFKEFFSPGNNPLFCNDVCTVMDTVLDTNTIQMSGVFLMSLQKLA